MAAVEDLHATHRRINVVAQRRPGLVGVLKDGTDRLYQVAFTYPRGDLGIAEELCRSHRSGGHHTDRVLGASVQRRAIVNSTLLKHTYAAHHACWGSYLVVQEENQEENDELGGCGKGGSQASGNAAHLDPAG